MFDIKRYAYGKKDVMRDIRPLYVRFGDKLQEPEYALTFCLMGVLSLVFLPSAVLFSDILLIVYLLFFWWLKTRDRSLPGKLPVGAPYLDRNNLTPGKDGTPEGILYLGNDITTGEQLWYSNSDARTHALYLGTTGSGKTEGLKSMVTNALTWGSGFVYVDGKADTDLWSSISSLVRRFGRDDDLLVLNYMTGNSDERAPSNTMNPFSSGSSSHLANMLVSLMPEAEGDNAMWKERAVSLLNSLMPALTWKRDNQDVPLSVSTLRQFMNLDRIIQISRDEAIPQKLRESLQGYLDTLPGYVDDAFDDNGKEKPVGPDQPMVDTTTVRQQHGYLTMQFTRALQSLGDDYGYIFDAQDADVDMVDIVLNRRVLVVLIPALEKSGDETANLGKILVATLKGMMGSSLGANLEGESSTIIENKPTFSSTPFMTVFDEVGYYTAQGMAVMAAQARSLGFSLVFAAQDLQAMEKRVKEEARSITANCNIKIFGKLQDPTQTREFFENHVGKAYVLKASSYNLTGGTMTTGGYHDTQQAQVDLGTRADYDDLKEMKEGEAIISFGGDLNQANIFYCNPGMAKAMRVTRFLALPPPDEHLLKHSEQMTKLRDCLVNKNWTAMGADVAVETPPEIAALAGGFQAGQAGTDSPIDAGIFALAELHARQFPEEAAKALEPEPDPVPDTPPTAAQEPPPVQATTPSEGVKNTAEKAISWKDLVDETPETLSSPPAGATQKIGYIKARLDEKTRNFLENSGKKIRDAIFKAKGTTDAAE